MDIETLREYCLSLPYATEDTAFGDDILLFRICNKIFGCIWLGNCDYFACKCNPDLAIDLRDRFSDVEPAYHWNKKYWNQLRLSGTLSDDMIRGLVRHSYSEVVAKLTKRVRLSYPDIEGISWNEDERP